MFNKALVKELRARIDQLVDSHIAFKQSTENIYERIVAEFHIPVSSIYYDRFTHLICAIQEFIGAKQEQRRKAKVEQEIRVQEYQARQAQHTAEKLADAAFRQKVEAIVLDLKSRKWEA